MLPSLRLHPSYAEVPLPDGVPLRAGLSLKESGDMRNVDRRVEFLRLFGVAPQRIYACRQVHSTRITCVRPGQPRT